MNMTYLYEHECLNQLTSTTVKCEKTQRVVIFKQASTLEDHKAIRTSKPKHRHLSPSFQSMQSTYTGMVPYPGNYCVTWMCVRTHHYHRVAYEVAVMNVTRHFAECMNPSFLTTYLDTREAKRQGLSS